MTLLTPVSQNTLADAVTDKIREAIIRGELRGGEKLTETSLAELLDVSRSPVREALVRLESEELLERSANRSVRVWHPTTDDIDEILSMRVMMESLAARLLIERLDENDFHVMERLLQKQQQAISNNDHFQLTRFDREFHDYLVERAGNSRLLKSWSRIMSQWELLIYLRIEHDPTVSGTVIRDHRNLIDGFRHRDLDRILSLHDAINHRVGEEMKAILEAAQQA